MLKPHMKIVYLVILISLLTVLAAGLIIATVMVYRSRQGDMEFSGTFVQQTGRLLTA